MTNQSVPRFVKTIDPPRGLTLLDGRQLTLRWADDLWQFGQQALEEMQLSIDEAQALLQSEHAINCQMADEEQRMHAAYLAGEARRIERRDQQRRAEQIVHCSRCGRKLVHWQSILKGVGPKCDRIVGSR